MKRLIFLVSLPLLLINSLLAENYSYDYVIFENSLMDGNYFYSQADNLFMSHPDVKKGS
jgi:hypothetical protein